jgi:hypothetical protein
LPRALLGSWSLLFRLLSRLVLDVDRGLPILAAKENEMVTKYEIYKDLLIF